MNPKKYVVFMEYRVSEEKRTEFLRAMEEISSAMLNEQVNNYEWFESVDQGALFVEMFAVNTLEQYNALKAKRTETDDRVYGRLDKFVPGGMKKVHCWCFEKNGPYSD
ncbi:Transmembrane secretion effector [Marinococcus luteus]|uniref:Transmembrane secretion effector n=1 Tax=Marinococcus luteus TaxID=1122204 RepID=A0A1H2X953_9BACI|nr:MFS transporter [Marinococcus luteus]SDW89327.1 Transmembrane secretion effector [Marinococcus luteus]